MNRERLVSVDAFRGPTVGAPILVNDPGDWVSSQVFLYRTAFGSRLALSASLAYAIANVVGGYFALWWMDKRGLYIKV